MRGEGTGPADRPFHAFVLVADHEQCGSRQIHASKLSRCASVQPDDLNPRRRRFGERAVERGDAAQRGVFHGARGRAERSRGERRRGVLAPNHGGIAERYCAAHDRSEVLGILDPVQGDPEKVLLADESRERSELELGCPSHGALVRPALTESIEERSARSLHAYTVILCETRQRFESGLRAALHDHTRQGRTVPAHGLAYRL